MTLCWRMSRPVDVTTVSIKAVRNDIPSNNNSNSKHVFLSFPPSQRSPQRHTSLVSHQTSHRIWLLRFNIITPLIIFFRLLSAKIFLFKKNFHQFVRFLFLIHTLHARGALLPMSFGHALLPLVALHSPPDRNVTSGNACFRTIVRSASMASKPQHLDEKVLYKTKPCVISPCHNISFRLFVRFHEKAF